MKDTNLPPRYAAIHGTYSVVGRRPDGDSLGFVPDDRDRLRVLPRGFRLRSNSTGTVQLRLEGIDAPEMHYGNSSQPLGHLGRDALLTFLGYTRVVLDRQDDTLITQADPLVRGTVLTQGSDANGRVLAYVLPEHLDGDEIELDSDLLDRTVNLQLVRSGTVYSTVYTSMPEEHRTHIQAAAREARTAGRGIWPKDKTNAFTLRTPQSIGESGQLILPKMFRRALAYLGSKRKRDTFPDWLRRGELGKQARNDRILQSDGSWITLADVLEQEGPRIRLTADPIDLVFEEVSVPGAIVPEGS